MNSSAPLPSFFVRGDFSPGLGALLTVENPSDESSVRIVETASVAQVGEAIAAAREAFDHGEWRSASTAQRIAALQGMVAWLVKNKQRVEDALVLEAGLVRASPMRYAQVDWPLQHAAEVLELYRALPDFEENPLPLRERISQNGVCQSLRMYEPVGVVAAIAAYNFPFFIAIWKIFPALVTGNTVVLRPNPVTPLSSILLAEAAAAAGLPPGVFNVVVETGAAGAVLLCTDPGVDMVTFTGSSQVGKQVMAQAAPTMKRLQLELGGKSAQIYLPDALDAAALAADRVCLAHSGQGCALGTRIFVPEAEKPAVLEAMKNVLGRAVVGPADDPSTNVGPLISAAQVGRCEEFVRLAVAAGGSVVCGGKRPAHLQKGHYYEPTILDVPSNDNPAAQEEIFGPVVSVIGYRDLDHAVEMANDSVYALSGHVYGKDLPAAVAVAQRMRTGTVHVNGGILSAFASSGGWHSSGVGRERGVEGLRIYQNIKCLGVLR